MTISLDWMSTSYVLILRQHIPIVPTSSTELVSME